MSRRIDRWRELAACRGSDPDLFFPSDDPHRRAEEIAAAKAVCAHCEVREACLEFALGSRQSVGIFGGLTPNERRRLRRVVSLEG